MKFFLEKNSTYFYIGRKAMLCGIFNHKLSSLKRQMPAQKTTFLDLSLCMITSFPSGTTRPSSSKDNLHEMHDHAPSHCGLFKKRISYFPLCYYSMNSFLVEKPISYQKLLVRADLEKW